MDKTSPTLHSRVAIPEVLLHGAIRQHRDSDIFAANQYYIRTNWGIGHSLEGILKAKRVIPCCSHRVPQGHDGLFEFMTPFLACPVGREPGPCIGSLDHYRGAIHERYAMLPIPIRDRLTQLSCRLFTHQTRRTPCAGNRRSWRLEAGGPMPPVQASGHTFRCAWTGLRQRA